MYCVILFKVYFGVCSSNDLAMAALKDLLHSAKSTSASFYDHSKDLVTVVKAKPVPPNRKWQGFVPWKPEDFGDGGAFPEIHIPGTRLAWHKDLIPKIISEELELEIQETTESTKAALEKIVNVRLSAAQPKNVPTQSSGFKFIKYKPSQQ
ncbi:hypothetical protein ACLOJK_021135 [Asimina triloba]